MSTTFRLVRSLCIAGALTALPTAVSVSAAADIADGVANDTKSIVTFWGATVLEDSYYVYGGAVYALNQDLSRDGWLARVSGGFGGVEYQTPGGEIDSRILNGDAMIGYHTFWNTVLLSAYAGVDIQDNDLSPNDPGNSTRGTEVGFKVQAEALTIQTDPFFMSLLANYSTANNSYYGQARVGYDFGPVIIGPEGSLLGNDEYDSQRIGAFISADGPAGINIFVSGGYSYTSGTSSDDSVYGSVGFSALF